MIYIVTELLSVTHSYWVYGSLIKTEIKTFSVAIAGEMQSQSLATCQKLIEFFACQANLLNNIKLNKYCFLNWLGKLLSRH